MSHTTAKRALFCASMLGGLLAATSALAAPALPTGGHVSAGAASIGGGGATLTVSQSSSKAIVDWSSFGVGQGGTVQFDNGSGATLNRVTGANVSSIDGLLSATGSIYLINPNGVIVGKSGVVNTGGSFVASTLDVSNASFLAGGPLTFAGPSVASVVNLGRVGSLGGNVGLIAATVKNDGSIAAPKGEAGLIAGSTVTMDDTANDAGGLFSVKVGGASTSATNTGAISAAAVELRAQQGNVYALAGNAGGVINATGLAASGGTIKLISTRGTTEVTGTLSAQGANGVGGQIETSGETLDIGAANVNAHGGSWLLDPTNLIINSAAATAIDASLATNNVTLTTSATGAPTETGGAGGVGDTASGPGDIIVAAPMSWSSPALLTLNAFAGITIQAPITVKGGGRVALNYNTTTSNLIFQLGGDIQFTGAESDGQGLGINGQAYTLLFNFANSGSHGPDTGLDDVAGIDNNTAAGSDSGFYALAQNVTATGTFTTIPVGSGGFDGVLEGLGNTISGFTLSIGAGNYGGVIGEIKSTGAVRDLGVVGGSVSGGSFVGGLAGLNYGTVSGDHTAMIVTGTQEVGGLIGHSSGGLVSRSYATGAVSGDSTVGGLIGYGRSTVELSYATGRVNASFEHAGGLVGYNYDGATIDNSYATGAVTSPVNVGGLVGFNDGGIIENSYATGAVLSAGTSAGGLIGNNHGTIVNSYYDTQTTGRSVGIGNDNNSQSGNVHGLLTVEMQTTAAASLGSAFAGGSGLYPFLTTFFPNGVQAVTGIVYSDGGAAPVAGGTVGVLGNGASFDTVTSGANGYYYAFGAAGTVAAGKLWLVYDVTDTAATIDTVTGSLSQPGLNLFGKTVTVTTSAITLSTAPTLAQAKTSDIAADGGLVAVTNFINADTSLGLISTGASFTVNQTTSIGGLVIETLGSAPLTVLDPITVTGGGPLGLDAGFGAVLGIDAAVKVTGGSPVNLDGSAIGFDLAGSSFAGSLSYALMGTGGIPGQSLTIDGNAYTLLYSMTDVAGINGTAGHDAIAAPITSTTPFTNSVDASFSGTLEGLGNTITNLNINAPGSKVGLIGTLQSGGVVRDIKLTNAQVAAASYVGALVGDNVSGATVTDDVAGGSTIDMGGGPAVGGLVGFNAGSVTLSSASSTVENNGTGFATGGLVGFNASGAVVTASSASGPVTGAAEYTGGLVGYSAGVLTNDSSTGNVTAPGELYVGGLAGYVASGGTVVSGATSGATVSGIGGSDVGGLVGINFGSITNSAASDTVVNNNHGASAGGLVGYNAGTGSILDSGASGAVNVGDNVHFAGGLVGYNLGAIDNDSATGAVTAPSSIYIGGLVGYNAAGGQVSSDFASGASVSATGSVAVGGLAGYNAGTIANTYADIGGVTGGTDVGGLAGYNAGTIANTYADIGGVTGGTDVGGLVGYNAGAVSLSWSSGAVSGTSIVGGSVGNEVAAGSLAHVFWDKGTSGRTVGSGAGSTTGLTAIGGTTGLNPHTQATYTGFNFTTIWNINAGSSRAFLRNPTPPTPPT